MSDVTSGVLMNLVPREAWPAMVNWVEEQRRRYTTALAAKLGEPNDGE